MEKRRTLFDYAAQVLTIYGLTMLLLNIFCLLFGDQAQEVSTLFAMGKNGIPVATAFEFLGATALIVVLRVLFFTDILFRQMKLVPRAACMVASVVAVIAVFVVCFGWFPADMWLAWAMFLLCFAVSFVLSLLVMLMKEKAENRQMEEALERLKRENHKACNNEAQK